MKKAFSEFSQQVENISSAISDILSPLDRAELESLVIDSIRKHRRELDKAELAYQAWRNAPDVDIPGKHALHAAYVQAMLDNCMQMAVVAALTERLGYVPKVDESAGNDTD